jgi:hypothetical protein
MVAVRLSGTVTEDRQLIIQLPDEFPVGPIELLVHSILQHENPLRTAARLKLAAAGLLGGAHLPPSDMIQPADEEVLKAGTLPPGTRPTHELIDEDRGER